MTTKPESPDSGAGADQLIAAWHVIYPNSDVILIDWLRKNWPAQDAAGIWTAIRGTNIDAAESAGDQAVAFIASYKGGVEFLQWPDDCAEYKERRKARGEPGLTPLYTRAQDAAGKGVEDEIEVDERMVDRAWVAFNACDPSSLWCKLEVALKAALVGAAKPAQVGQKDTDRLDWLQTQMRDVVDNDPRDGSPVLVAQAWSVEGPTNDVRDCIDHYMGGAVVPAQDGDK